MDDAQIPVTGLEELESHLEQIVDDSETPLNVKLFDEVEVQLNGMSSLPTLREIGALQDSHLVFYTQVT